MVANSCDFAIAHVPHHAMFILQSGNPKPYFNDRAGNWAHINDVTDGILIFDDHADTCKVILDECLSAKTNSNTDDACGCQNWSHVDS